MATSRKMYPWRDEGILTYGLEFPEAAEEQIKRLGKKRVFLVASGGLSRNTDEVKRLEKKLGDTIVGRKIGIQPHSLWSEILEIADAVRAADADCILTIGGGSITDTSKIVSIALANDAKTYDDLERLRAVGIGNGDRRAPPNTIAPKHPIICIPTTLSAGEYSAYCGGTDPRTLQKKSFHHFGAIPAVVVLDPKLTKTCPEWAWLSTGVRSVDHCVETLASLNSIPEADNAAAEALALLLPSLLRTKVDPDDLDARLQSQLGSNIAMDPICRGIAMGASHAIGHQLGPFGVGHGQTSCILCPAVMKYNSKVNAVRQERIHEIIWSDPLIKKTLESRGLKTEDSDVGECLHIYFKELGMPRSLKEVGIEKDMFDKISRNALLDFWAKQNPIPLESPEQVQQILTMVA